MLFTVIISMTVSLIVVCTLLCGVVVLAIGARGKRDHPRPCCPACTYDLSGLDWWRDPCPECGDQPIVNPDWRRRRRFRADLVLLGLGLLVLGGVPTASLILHSTHDNVVAVGGPALNSPTGNNGLRAALLPTLSLDPPTATHEPAASQDPTPPLTRAIIQTRHARQQGSAPSTPVRNGWASMFTTDSPSRHSTPLTRSEDELTSPIGRYADLLRRAIARDGTATLLPSLPSHDAVISLDLLADEPRKPPPRDRHALP